MVRTLFLAGTDRGVGKSAIAAALRAELATRDEVVEIVDPPGGALAPLDRDEPALDQAVRLGATVLVVGADRAGVESQVLLVLEAARRRALPIAAAVLSGDTLLDPERARAIRERGGITVLSAASTTALADAVLAALDRP